jgi:hypothetical protein
MTIVVHASDCKAIQCKPIDKQSAVIVAIRPAQRNMTARLALTFADVNEAIRRQHMAFLIRRITMRAASQKLFASRGRWSVEVNAELPVFVHNTSLQAVAD